MNLAFLILIAAPLSIYLIIVLFTMQDIEPTDAPDDAPALEIIPPTDVLAAPSSEPMESASVRAETGEPSANAAQLLERDAVDTLTALMPENAFAPDTENFDAPLAVAENASPDQVARADASEPIELAESVGAANAANIPLAENVSADAGETIITELERRAAMENVGAVDANQAVDADQDVDADQNVDADQAVDTNQDVDADQADLSDSPLRFPEKGSPKFVFDYRGRLWVEKKNKGFFRRLRRPQLPPDEPDAR
ncbi:MAG: hypothetical protein BroJett039_11590 [Chloroflexota bacterium]|nr:MAG: hypothetical protein BroJett039_11590 [Chloroflexota bacterium]